MDKEKTFEWNDELVAEYSQRLPSYYNQGHSSESAFEEFKKEKLKESIKPIVTRCNYDDYSVYFYIDNKAPSIKVDKDRMAEILISEREGRYWIDDKFMWYREDNEIIKDKKYSEQDYLEFGQKCFEAARKNNSEWYYKFKNFSDYMNKESKDK